MRRYRNILIVLSALGLILAGGTQLWAEEVKTPPKPAKIAEAVKEDVKKTGEDAKGAGKDLGEDVGQRVRQTPNDFRKAIQDTKEAFNNAFKK